MRAEDARATLGRWCLDERGRPLGEVVGIVHHPDGRTSLLVHGGSLWSGLGMMIAPEDAVLADDELHLTGRPQPRARNGLLDRIGEAMWPSPTATDR